MKLMKPLASLFLCLIVACAHVGSRNDTERILNETRPAVMHLQSGKSSCSAFAIEGNLIISAAHCLSDADDKDKELVLTDHRNFRYYPKLLAVDFKRDLMLLQAPGYTGKVLELWEGEIPVGTEIITEGYPGMNDLEFYWNRDLVRYVTNKGGVELVAAGDSIYFGASGGCAVDAKTGMVIGMNDMLSDRTTWMEFPFHKHGVQSYFISSNEIIKFVERYEAAKAEATATTK